VYNDQGDHLFVNERSIANDGNKRKYPANIQQIKTVVVVYGKKMKLSSKFLNTLGNVGCIAN